MYGYKKLYFEHTKGLAGHGCCSETMRKRRRDPEVVCPCVAQFLEHLSPLPHLYPYLTLYTRRNTIAECFLTCTWIDWAQCVYTRRGRIDVIDRNAAMTNKPEGRGKGREGRIFDEQEIDNTIWSCMQTTSNSRFSTI